MGMGTRKSQEQQEEIWIANADMTRSSGHPFYQRLNELLDAEKFDEFVEGHCRKFYAATMGRPGLVPGIYFRSLLIGYFEGIVSGDALHHAAGYGRELRGVSDGAGEGFRDRNADTGTVGAHGPQAEEAHVK